MKAIFGLYAALALSAMGALSPAPSLAGFADPVVRPAPLPSGATAYSLDLRDYCKKRYGSRYYPHLFGCWTGYQSDRPVRIDPTAACQSVYGDSYRAIESGTDLGCIDR